MALLEVEYIPVTPLCQVAEKNKVFIGEIKPVPKVKRRGRVLRRKLRNYKTLVELAQEYGVRRQTLNQRLWVRKIPFEEVGSGKQPTIVVHRRYWAELKVSVMGRPRKQLPEA